MLFDLRSRGRRRTVRVLYGGLAFLMLSGLVLFGVGAGSSGGLLNAFTNSGSSSGQSAAVTQETKAALKATKLNPKSAAAWASLVQAQWTAANQGSNVDAASATTTFTAAGKKELAATTESWQTYTGLIKTPNPDIAILAARAYSQLAQYAEEASAWQDVSIADSQAAKGYECWAFAAAAAKETRTAALAGAKAVSLVPKLQQLTLKQDLTAAKSSPEFAQDC